MQKKTDVMMRDFSGVSSAKLATIKELATVSKPTQREHEHRIFATCLHT